MMSIPNATLPEDVFPFPSMPPSKDDADELGYVLWFHPVHGWCQGMWKWPTFTGCTHWTYIPPRPPGKESAEDKCERLFTEWAASFDHSFDKAATALMRMGWNGAFKKLHQYP